MVRTKLSLVFLLLFVLCMGFSSPAFAASTSTHLGISQHNQLKTLVNARPQAARSVTITLSNRSGETLHRENWALDHGIWTTLPPESIPNHAVVTWESESNGFMTGTEGHIYYSIGNTGYWTYMYWDNPFIGSNSYNQVVSGGGYEIDPSGRGDGNNSGIKYIIS